MKGLNPNAFIILWALTLLMAGAISLGPVWVIAVGVITIVDVIVALL